MCTEANKESLIAFVYGELPRDEQRAFEAHVSACAPCRAEVAGLREVRDDLLAWSPPECRDLPSSWAEAPPAIVRPMDRMRAWAPVFGLAAAAMLLLAVSAAIANLQIRYGSDGLIVSTGRAVAAPAALSEAAQAEAAQTLGFAQPASVTASDLTELEERLRRTFDTAGAHAPMRALAVSSTNPQLSRETRRLIEEAEDRVYQQMATRLIEIDGVWNSRRSQDYQQLVQTVNLLERRYGVDLANLRTELNRLTLVVQGQGQK